MSVDDLVDWFSVSLSTDEIGRIVREKIRNRNSKEFARITAEYLGKDMDQDWQFKTWTDEDGYVWVLGRVVPEER